jgi:peptidoglycan hydrolase-like protein with peptidoglycan-binding domain
MFEFLKGIPLLMQIMHIKDRVVDHLRAGDSVLKMLRDEGPAVLDVLVKLGDEFFPDVADPEKKVQAAAMKTFDPSYVKGVQAALNKVHGSGLKVDGDYGDKTKAAVVKYQKERGIDPADGWAGKATNAALQAESAKKA